MYIPTISYVSVVDIFVTIQVSTGSEDSKTHQCAFLEICPRFLLTPSSAICLASSSDSALVVVSSNCADSDSLQTKFCLSNLHNYAVVTSFPEYKCTSVLCTN